MKNIALLYFILLTVNFFAQNDVGRSYNLFWLNYSNSIQLNSKWGINTDVQHRTTNGFEKQTLSAMRSAIAYQVNNFIFVSAGGAYFRNYLHNDLSRGEWRSHQELLTTLDLGKAKIINRIRVEERFVQVVFHDELTNNYEFNWRFRYKIDVEFPLFIQNERVHSIGLGNEFMFNEGGEIVNRFDQNRASISFNFEFSKNVKLQFQYIYIAQYISSKDNIDKISAFRLNLQHKIRL